MRTFLVALLGGALVFAFFWYRGDIGEIRVGDVVLAPPNQQPDFMKRLQALQEADRSIAGDLAGSDSEAVRAGAETVPRMYAGQLIAKPKTVVETQGIGNLAVAASSFASFASPAGNAIRAAGELGDVETTLGNTLLINLDFDVPAVPAAAGEAVVSAQGFGGLPTGNLVQPLSFGGRWQARAEAQQESSRQLVRRTATCPPGVTEAQLAGNVALRVVCAAQRLEATGQFEYVEPNVIVSHQMERGGKGVSALPTDPLFPLQWHYLTQATPAPGATLTAAQSAGGAGFVDFWQTQQQFGSRSVVVAVIDTGIDKTHPDIMASGNIAPGVDMISQPYYANDGDGRDLDAHDDGDACPERDGPFAENTYHGTHVAGTIGAVATNNGAGVSGGAWNVTLVPIRALGRCGGLQSDINDAIRWAAGVEPVIVEDANGGTIVYENPNPAQIINLSLGFPAPGGCPRSTQSAIDDAVAAGAIVVAAAGNAAINVDNYGPAGCNNVVTVSAGDGIGQLAFYSNWGDKVDIMAPGGDTRRDLNGDGWPDGVLSTKRTKNCRDPLAGGGAQVAECSYAFENGTSMASPHVAAAFALLKAEYPTRSNSQLISMLVDQARTPRTRDQCTTSCGASGGEPVPGQAGMCYRPCGSGLLDLAKVGG